jgi:hypothetical protein
MWWLLWLATMATAATTLLAGISSWWVAGPVVASLVILAVWDERAKQARRKRTLPQEPEINSDQTPIIPQHDKPVFLTPNGKPCLGTEEKYDFILFDCFRTFGEFFNSWRGSTPFRLQELSDTRITYRLGKLDLGPRYGHRYEIFYYQSKVGLLQIYASRSPIEDERVAVDIVLDAPERMIPYDALRDFLFDIARMLSSDQKDCYYTDYQYRGMTQRDYAIYAIEQAMMRALWDNTGSMKERQHEKFSPITIDFVGAPTEWIEQIGFDLAGQLK